jgi:DNA-binding NarL/FixJ family response regulator
VPIRCLIVDDNRGFLEAARVLLERQGLAVAGVASTGAEARPQARTLRPDVILVDIWLGEESGLDLARSLVGVAPVVLISTRSQDDVADLISDSPVAGFVTKSELSAIAIRRLVEPAR